jgi:predicted TIM-barrel fold metal-dependent hydrolase
MKNFYVDISWTELAKYIVATPETTAAAADLINRYPDRFLFGTDEVAPTDPVNLKIVDISQPLFARLTPDTKQKVLKGNCEATVRQRATEGPAWEAAHVK